MVIQKQTNDPSLKSPTFAPLRKFPDRMVRLVSQQMPRVRRLSPLFFVVGAIVLVALLVLAWVLFSRFGETADSVASYTVGRGNLTVSITENGNIKALKSVDIKSDVEGQVTIIKIVPEGTFITPEDVKKKKVLVELDSAALKEKYTQQKIATSNAQASYEEAVESYEIQLNQNNSDIKGGERKLKFAKMDLQKYVGEIIAQQLIQAGEVYAATQASQPATTRPVVNMTALSRDPNLRGAAQQKIRELQSKIELASEELTRATTKLEWTEKLYAKNYVSGEDVRADRLAVKSKTIDLEQAKTNLDLYIRYDFPKETEKALEDYYEAYRELERIRAKTRSLLAQALAKRTGMEASYKLQKDQLEKVRDQLEACIIRAPASGLVVYGTSNDFWARQNNPIQAGAQVYQRQTILSIPNNMQMIVEFKVHETWVQKIKPGLAAEITMDAFPDQHFTGKVTKIAPLADPQNWINPDLKVFTTEVTIDGIHPFLKTGMSAKVKVIVQRLFNVINVPIQAVVSQKGKKYCYIAAAFGSPQLREVQTGASNDNFMEITHGLKVGEKVLLNPPRLSDDDEKMESKENAPQTSQPVTTAPASQPATRPATQPATKPAAQTQPAKPAVKTNK